MVNYLERARALAECSSTCNNETASQLSVRPGRLSKVNFNGHWRDNSAYGYKTTKEIIVNNSNYLKDENIGFSNVSTPNSPHYRCCCGLMHSVTGTRIFLLIYVALSVITFTFLMKSAMLWSVIPFAVTLLSVYALCTEKHKYLYPFLIISGVHIVLSITMVLIIIALTAANYAAFRQIVGYSVKIQLTDTFIVVIVIASVVLFLTLSVIHLWQVTVVYSCMLYFEEKHYCEHEQYQPMIAKDTYGRRLEDGQPGVYHNHLATYKCYKSCASV